MTAGSTTPTRPALASVAAAHLTPIPTATAPPIATMAATTTPTRPALASVAVATLTLIAMATVYWIAMTPALAKWAHHRMDARNKRRTMLWKSPALDWGLLSTITFQPLRTKSHMPRRQNTAPQKRLC
ncbi:MAG: hypothetical protein GYB66_11270 [Chloroflexi bacterium]|nr:hypothetical protein [Chloroflexota bacterium]